MRATSNGAGGVAHLMDIQTVDGDIYYWSDQPLVGIPAVITADGNPANVAYVDWIIQAPTFTRNRSMSSYTDSLKIANVFGDTLATQLERTLRKSAFEGALFAYRWWAISAEMADLEVHGTLSVGDVNQPEVTLSVTNSFDGSNRNAPEWQFSESCQLTWGLKRCGSTQPTECLYSLQSCQVIERIVSISNTYYDKNMADAVSAVQSIQANRRRGV